MNRKSFLSSLLGIAGLALTKKEESDKAVGILSSGKLVGGSNIELTTHADVMDITTRDSAGWRELVHSSPNENMICNNPQEGIIALSMEDGREYVYRNGRWIRTYIYGGIVS